MTYSIQLWGAAKISNINNRAHLRERAREAAAPGPDIIKGPPYR